MKDLENNYLAELVVAIDDLGGRVNLVGLCQGGWMSAMIAAPGGGGAMLRVTTPTAPEAARSGPGCSVPVRPSHLLGLIPASSTPLAQAHRTALGRLPRYGGLYAMVSLCGSAQATREWFRAFTASRPFLACRPLRPPQCTNKGLAFTAKYPLLTSIPFI